MIFLCSLVLVDLLLYDYCDFGLLFVWFDGIICELFDIVILLCYFVIVLYESKLLYYMGMLDLGKIDEKISFYLVVNVDLLVIELVDVVLLCFKIGVFEDVEKFVLVVLFGVKLVYLL